MSNTDNPFGAPVVEDDVFEIGEMPEDEGYRVPAGEYPAKVISLDKGTSQSSGNPMWIWTFALLFGKYAGREFKLYTVLSPAAMWKLRETLLALKLSDGKGPTKFEKSKAIGARCNLVLVDGEYGGVKRSDVKTVKPYAPKPGEETAAPAAADSDIPF